MTLSLRKKKGPPKGHEFRPLRDRFWAKVNKNGTIPPHRQDLGPCWVWTGWRQRASLHYPHLFPYGFIKIKGRRTFAHRVSWELNVGEIPEGRLVCHRCDVPFCVNPDHLFLGSPKENTVDMLTKGRGAGQSGTRFQPDVIGGKNGLARLAELDVIEIRRSKLSVKELATRFSVGATTVRHVLKGDTWKHVQ